MEIWENFLHQRDREKVLKECKKLDLDMHLDSGQTRRRYLQQIPSESEIYDVFSRGYIREKLHDVGLSDHELETVHLGIEYRKYTQGGFMGWHTDDIHFDPVQLELVYTVDNDSDSTFVWSDAGLHAYGPAPNSVILVKAGGVKHQVTKVTKGTRSILKLVFVKRGAKWKE